MINLFVIDPQPIVSVDSKPFLSEYDFKCGLHCLKTWKKPRII